MTVAPWFAAQMIPAVRSAVSPVPVSGHDLDRQDLVPPADAGDPVAVVRVRGDDAGDPGSVAVVVGRVRIGVHEVVAGQHPADEVGVVGLHAGVEDGDHARAALRERPCVAHPHPVERVLAGRLRVVDGDRGDAAFVLDQLDHVIGVGVRDSRIRTQLGEDILDRSAGGRQNGWLALARNAELRHEGQPSSARDTRALVRLAPLHDDLAGHHLARLGRLGGLVVVGGHRHGGRDEAEDGENGGEESCHAGWAPVWSDETGVQETRQPARCQHPTGEGCLQTPDDGLGAGWDRWTGR